MPFVSIILQALLAIALMLYPISCHAAEYREAVMLLKVEAVHDGDTVDVHLNGLGDHIRLMGIDAPELKQPKWGIAARDRLRDLVLGKTVKVVILNAERPRDAYGRLLAYLYVGDVWVQKTLVTEGLVIPKYYGTKPRLYDELVKAGQTAFAANSGVWADPLFVDPEKWRKK